jgi:WD40 repeat protein/DNA-binding SARP family transcriptional activator/energy-coupling factor transporter ATP-binding protein EcfA2
MSIGVLGPLLVGGNTVGLGPRDRVVLAALVAQRGEVISAESLADALWGEDLPASWNKVVQGCVMRLRKTLGAGAVETHSHGYSLVVPTDDIDASKFERRVLRAREMLTLDEPDRAIHLLDEALGLWRGRPLVELEDWAPGHIEAERLEELRRDAEELWVSAAVQAGRWREVLSDARALVARAPLRELRWALLALAQYQAGRQAEALATVREARKYLVEEHGLDPGADLVDLEDAILQHDPSLLPDTVLPDVSSECPYLGLVSYDLDDADAFYGRDRDVSECLGRLTNVGVLVVVGPSGSGKSSLVRAGVGAALQRDGRRVAVITPGSRPMTSLPASASDPLPVLIVDQCEEAVTLCPDTSEQARFFDALAAHSDKTYLIVALRADRLGEMSVFPRFASLIERGLFLLGAMNGEDLRAAIEGPARHAGLVLEPGLVDLLVRDVEGEPGALPLLSHALRQTWERREGRTLTVDGYRVSGGIWGAVAQSAEQVYEHAPPEKRPILRDLLLRLVTPSPEGDPVRSRVPRRVVASDPAHEQVIEELVAARLVTSDEDNVELAHEALARAWPRLREWLADDVEGQRIWRHLAAAADAWETMGRPDSELYRGVRLARAMEWRQSSGADLNPTELDFLDASQLAVDRERLAAEEEAKHQARVNRRLRLLVGGVAAFAIVATIGGLIAVRQSQRADLSADIARSHELAASAVGVLADDPSLAKLLAVAAARIAPDPTLESLAALHRTAAADLSRGRYHATYDIGLFWTDIHPSGDRMVAAGTHPVDGSGGILEVVDPYSDRLLWSFDIGHLGLGSAYIGSPFFTGDGAHLVVGVFWDPHNRMRVAEGVAEPPIDQMGAFIMDADTGDVVERFDLGRCGGWVVGMSDTNLLARTLRGTPEVLAECRWQDGNWAVELVDRQSGKRQVLGSGTGTWWGGAVSGDGRLVAYDDEGDIVVVDVESGTELLRRTGEGVRAMNHDGSLLLAGDQPMEVWDVAAGEIAASFNGHGGPSLFARFDPAGNTIHSTGADGTLRVWDAMTGQEQFVYPGVGNGRPSMTDDGIILVSRPDRDTAVVLDTRLRGELGAVETCAGSTAPDSLRIINQLAVFQIDCADSSAGTTYLVDLAGLEVLYTLPSDRGGGLAVSPDGTRFVLQEGEGSVHGVLVVRDLRSGEQVVELEGLCVWDAVWELPAEQQDGCQLYPDQPFPIDADRIVWSPDGTLIAAAVDTGLVVWDAKTGDLIFTEAPDPSRIQTRDLIFTPDSDQLVATAGDMSWRLLSTETWSSVNERAVFVDGGHQLGLIGYPDGNTLLAAGAFQAATAPALHWFDSETWDWRLVKSNIHEGSLQAATLDQSGTRIATAATDGFVRIWDVANGDVIQEIPFGDVPVRGVGFVGDHRLAVALDGGGLVIVTTDPDELLDVVAGSLTRGFSLTECERFNFGADCPTLADLRGPGPGINDLSGVFQLQWSRDDLAAEFVNTAVRDGVDPDDDMLLQGTNELASLYAGAYVMTLADGRFDIDVDTFEDAYCTGTYTVEGDRIWLHSERGSICVEVKLFDAGFELRDHELRFDFDDFRGPWPDKHVFATRPWKKIG